MKGVLLVSAMTILLMASSLSYAGQKDSRNILREGLLGAGAGAVGGAVSGADGGDLWKGALAGAGVNIVGGVLLDSISGEQVGTVDEVESMNPRGAYSEGYQSGFQSGYKQGYKEGYGSGLKER